MKKTKKKKFFLIILLTFIIIQNAYSIQSQVVQKLNEFTDTLIEKYISLKGENIPIAIAEFSNNDQYTKENNIGAAVTDIMIDRFANSRKFIILEKKQIDKVLDLLQLQQTGLYNPDKVVSIGKLIGAKIIILGSVSKFGGFYRITVRSVDIETSEVISSDSFELDSILLEKESEKYLPPSYRIFLGGHGVYLSLDGEFREIISGRVGFTLDINKWHTIPFYFSIGKINNRNYGLEYNVGNYYFSRELNEDITYEFTSGYGYILNITKFFSIRPILYVGYFITKYNLSYTIRSNVNSYSNERDKYYQTLTLNPAVDLLFNYYNPISFVISFGYYRPFKDIDEEIIYNDVKFEYKQSFHGPTLQLGVMVYL